MAGNFNLNDYITVNQRIEKFYEKYPEGTIQTEMVEHKDTFVIFKAYAYRNEDDKRPATGHAMEIDGSSFINKTSHIENCETSAVGRALAMLGFEISKSVASQEEVANARLQQEELAKPIDENTANILNTIIMDKGKNLEEILKYYKVKELKDLTKEQSAQLKKHLLAKDGK
jgi:hypothetical protein